MAYKNTNTWSEKIMKNALRKYWKLFCRNTCFESILQCVLQNWWEEFRNLIQNQQLLCKNSETWSASSYITTFYFRTPKYNKQLLRVKSVANFSYSIKKEKIYTGERRSYDLLVRRNKINYQKKTECVTSLYWVIPSLLFSLFGFIFVISLLSTLGDVIFEWPKTFLKKFYNKKLALALFDCFSQEIR